MEYYEPLGLEREPFQTTADPYFFYRSQEHAEALQRLEISVRLRRGLNLILGDIGTGKTSMGEVLKQMLLREDRFIIGTILDPSFKSEFQFLTNIVNLLGIDPPRRSTISYKNAVKNYLFQKGVKEDKTVVLLIDEGQKLTPTYLEVLRLFLNYQTPDFFLINIIVLAQLDLLPKLKRRRSFMDRVAVTYMLNPLNREDTEKMIRFRLDRAGFSGNQELFTKEAVDVIYEHSKGMPRKITALCHDCLEQLITSDTNVVTDDLVRDVVNRQVKIR